MSVYKSRRKDAAAQFIADAREAKKVTCRVVKRFPKSYRYVSTNKILELASEVVDKCRRGNAIFLHKDISQNDYELRRRWLRMAEGAADSLCGEITDLYEMVDDGNNFFKSREEYDRVFQNWIAACSTSLKRIRSVLASDQNRYRGYQKAKAESK
jgi:hypothetical protein